MSTSHYRVSRFEQAGDPIPFFRVLVRLLCAAGLRIDEAWRTRRCDIEVIAKRVHAGQAKTDAGVRAVQLTPDTVADVERYLRLTADRREPPAADEQRHPLQLHGREFDDHQAARR